MNKYDIFISYSRQDKSTADMICKHLDANNISYFRDIFDISISSTFTQTLADAILNCKLVLFIGSKHSFVSNYTSKEIAFAYQNHIAILPLLTDDSQMPTRYSFMFSDVQCLSLENTTMPRLMSDIKSLLAEQNGKVQAPAPAHERANITPKRSKKWGKIVPITLIFVLLAGAVGVGIYLFPRTKSEAPEVEVIADHDGEYYHITGTRKLTEEDLKGLSSEQLRIMRNEIYARNGYIFQDRKLREYFMQKSWYSPVSRDISLTQIEQYNVLFIKGYE